MADVGSIHFVKDRGTQVLVPQPSADPQDPLVRVLFSHYIVSLISDAHVRTGAENGSSLLCRWPQRCLSVKAWVL